MVRECQVKKDCIYCKMKGNHHRSLCPKQFGKQIEGNITTAEKR